MSKRVTNSSTPMLCCAAVVAVVFLVLSVEFADGAPRPHQRFSHNSNRNHHNCTHPASGRERRASICRHAFKDPMHIKDAASLSFCPYRVSTDFNVDRIPQKIEHVVCLETGCKKCRDEGDYTCTQLTSRIEVAFVNNVTNVIDRRDTVHVRFGCVCATKSGTPAIPAPKPKLVH